MARMSFWDEHLPFYSLIRQVIHQNDGEEKRILFRMDRSRSQWTGWYDSERMERSEKILCLNSNLNVSIHVLLLCSYEFIWHRSNGFASRWEPMNSDEGDLDALQKFCLVWMSIIFIPRPHIRFPRRQYLRVILDYEEMTPNVYHRVSFRINFSWTPNVHDRLSGSWLDFPERWWQEDGDHDHHSESWWLLQWRKSS